MFFDDVTRKFHRNSLWWFPVQGLFWLISEPQTVCSGQVGRTSRRPQLQLARFEPGQAELASWATAKEWSASRPGCLQINYVHFVQEIGQQVRTKENLEHQWMKKRHSVRKATRLYLYKWWWIPVSYSWAMQALNMFKLNTAMKVRNACYVFWTIQFTSSPNINLSRDFDQMRILKMLHTCKQGFFKVWPWWPLTHF